MSELSESSLGSSSYISSSPSCFFNLRKVENLQRATCNECGDACYGVRYRCTICPDFDICVDCFHVLSFKHANHQFDEVDLAYLINKLRQDYSHTLVDENCLGFVKSDVDCYTCFDHTPGTILHVMLVDREAKVLDAGKLSDAQCSMWRSLESENAMSEATALFLLHRNNWNKQQAMEDFNTAFEGKNHLAYMEFSQIQYTSWWSQHYISLSDLARSTQKGCQTCSLIARGLAAASPTMVLEDHSILMGTTPTNISIQGKTDGRTLSCLQWRFRTLPGADPPWKNMEIAQEYASHFKSEQCFNILRSWIQECDVKHSHLFCNGADQPLPSRLTFVGDQQTDLTIKLVEVPELSMGRYIALSHCWGTSPTLKTTVSNLVSMCENIKVKALPKTFLDAIHCARMLNIQYIWIDSLCIVQGDKSDWERESARMCDYYRNAWLVVVAASAQGDTHGFLGKRPPIFQGIPLQSRDGSGTYDTCISEDFPHIQGETFFGTDHQGDFTQSRAWCLQETALARRVVAFHRAEMTWSCCSATMCECGEASVLSNARAPTASFRPMMDDWLDTKMPKHHYSCIPGERFSNPSVGWTYYEKPFTRFTSSLSTYEEWRVMLVPIYTKLMMTHRSDRLPALSGLAALVGAEVQCSYLAGIWSHDIQLGLLWEIEKGAELPAHPCPNAPSFSWASLDQPILYRIPGFTVFGPANSLLGDTRVELIDFSIDLVGSNTYGAVSGGYVKLRGLVSQVMLVLEDGVFKVTTQGMPRNCTSENDTLVRIDTCLQKIEVRDSDGRRIPTLGRANTKTDGPNGSETPVDCLIVADVRTPAKKTFPPHFDVNCEEYAILLLGKMDLADDVWSYQRLGKAVLVFEPGDGPRWLTQAKQQELIIR
jgi:hypothetical protein